MGSCEILNLDIINNKFVNETQINVYITKNQQQIISGKIFIKLINNIINNNNNTNSNEVVQKNNYKN
jgi:hypothetical protein